MRHKKVTCLICEEGILTPKIGTELQVYKNITRNLNFHYFECDCCGSETATSYQIRSNKREMIKFQKEVDGLLSSSEIKSIRKSLNLTVKIAGELFGGGPVAFSKYENDDLIQSLPMDSALRLAQSNPHSILDLAKVRRVVLPKKLPTLVSSPWIIPLHDDYSFSADAFSYESEPKTIPVNIINFPVINNFLEVFDHVQ